MFASDAALANLMERHLADAGQAFAPGTAKRIGSNLSALARGVGSDGAADSAQNFRNLATRAAYKRERLQSVQRRKAHLTVAQMQGLRRAIAANAASSCLLAIRDLAIFDTACDLLASRAEITKMRLTDLSLPEATLRFKSARSRRTDHGAVFAISQRTLASIASWLDASSLRNLDVANPGSVPLFVGIAGNGRVRLGQDGALEPIDGRTVARALQRYATPLGISGVAGHSLRRSMARALYEAGVPEDEIVRKGRWSSLDQMRAYVGLTAPI